MASVARVVLYLPTLVSEFLSKFHDKLMIMFKWFPSLLLKFSHLALIALWVTLVTACSPTPLPDALLSVTPQTLALEAGATAVSLTATVQNSNSEVKWALEGEGTLSSLKGKITNYTPPATLNTVVSAKITATLEGTKLSQLVSVTLSPKPKLVITPPTDLSNVIAGGPKIRFSAALSSGVSGAKNKQAKQPRLSPLVPSLAQWSLEGPGSLDPSQGEFTDYTPPTEVNTSTPVKLTVRLGTLEQTFSFNIQPKPLGAALSLSPSSQTITAGTVGTAFTATLFNSTEALSWSLTGLGTLSSTTGKTVTYTPPSSVSRTETATLTVRAGALSQQATLTIQPAPILTVSPSSATFTAGDTGQSFTATLENSLEPINWTLEGVGLLSSTTGKTVVYTPPSSVTKDETVKLTARAGFTFQTITLIVNSASVAAPIIEGSLKEANRQGLLNWSKGIVEVVFKSPLNYGDITSTYIEVGRVFTDTEGKFTFALPDKKSLPASKPFFSFLKSQSCSGPLISRFLDAPVAPLQAEVWKNGSNVGYLIPGLNAGGSFSTTSRGYVYSDLAINIQGALRCSSSSPSFTSDFIFDLKFGRGWNQTVNLIDDEPTPITQTLSTENISAQNWVLQTY